MRVQRRHAAARVTGRALAAALAGLLGVLPGPAPAPAAVVVEFPGPVPVSFLGDIVSAAAVDFPDHTDRLVVGSSAGELTMVRYNPTSGVFSTIAGLEIGGAVVSMAPVTDALGSVTELLVATRDPDRVVTVRVNRALPFMVNLGWADLEEDPGAVARVAGGVAVVTLPGIDRVQWLARGEAHWVGGAAADAGDRPVAVLAADLDGDAVAEVVVANAGVLSRSVMVFRSGAGGYALDTHLDLPGAPVALAAGDADGDGRAELAVVSVDTALAWVLNEAAGALVETARLELTVPADGVHLAALSGDRWGLYPSSSARGLLEYYRNDTGPWLRRDGYYPGCRPLAVITADLNGDAIADLISLGGSARLVTVMFGNPDLAYWGFPALALPGRPSALGLGDFDGNGLNDAVVMSSDAGTIGFFRGRADGGLVVSPEVQEIFLLPGPMTVIAADGVPGPELAVHDRLAGAISILSHGPDGFAVTATTPLPVDSRQLTAADVDGDGLEDLVLLTGALPDVRVLFGAGDQTFPTIVSFGFENKLTGVLAVDLDADGLLDLVGVDGVNRVWTALNRGGRGFQFNSWLNAGSGSRSLSLGDLDGDLDQDVVVAGLTDEVLTLLENTGAGQLNRRVGSLALEGRPEGALVEDVNQDGVQDVVVNLREAGVIAVVYGLTGWTYTPPVNFAAGGDVTFFATGDFNTDLVPDILTLDASLRLGLTMLNVERGLVPVARDALAASCDDGLLAVVVRPDRGGPWRLDLEDADGRRTLATDAGARDGELAGEAGAWYWRGEGPRRGKANLRLVVGAGAATENLVLPVAACGGGGPPRRPVAWTREPWPNPFNPVVNARFSLGRAGPVTAAVYDLRGRLVATLAEGWLAAGDHDLRWDGTRDGRPAEAGVYLLRVSGEQATVTGKLLLLK